MVRNTNHTSYIHSYYELYVLHHDRKEDLFMHAALISAFGEAPTYTEVPSPKTPRAGEAHGTVLASALYHLVRSRADGSHYSSDQELPLIPGMDAVVRDDDGNLRYVLSPATMADEINFEVARSVALPNDVDPVLVAASMNAAMASWVALRHRATMPEHASVLILGATGNSGRLAIQIAKRFGAEFVIAAGRNPAKLAPLAALGADRTVTFDEIDTAADVDIVIDYLWGDVTAKTMPTLIRHRSDRSTPLTWIEIGAMAGPSSAILSAALRSSNLTIVGSGIGSVSAREFKTELPEIAHVASSGAFAVSPRPVPLANINEAWDLPIPSDERIVFVP